MRKKNYFINTIKNILIYILFISFIQTLFYKQFKSGNKLHFSLILLIPAMILVTYFFLKYKKMLIKDFKSFNKKDIKKIILYLILEFILVILCNYLINYIIFKNGISPNELGNEQLLFNNILSYSIYSVLLVPFIEEVAFRIELKKDKNYYKYIIISTLLFGLMHITTIKSFIDILYIIPYLIMGYAFSKIYYKTNNIYSNILMHALHNLFSILTILIMKGLL